MQQTEQQRAGLWGTVVGDAIGLKYETLTQDQIPPLPADLFDTPPPPFQRKHAAVASGSFSDDGSQALCLAASLDACDAFNAQDFGNRLLRWFDTGYMAANGTTFGSGGTTRRALDAIRRGVPADRAGIMADDALGNGPLMRGIPLPLWWERGDDTLLIRDAMAQCRVTHVHPRAQVVSAIHAMWVRRMTYSPHGGPLAHAIHAVGDVRSFVRRLGLWGDVFHLADRELDLVESLLSGDAEPSGGFYIVDTLHSAVWCNEHAFDFETVLAAAISLGNDTDTTCAVAGGVAALRFGRDSIPKHWREAVWAVAPPEARALLVEP